MKTDTIDMIQFIDGLLRATSRIGYTGWLKRTPKYTRNVRIRDLANSRILIYIYY
jgi:hypothetical protein